MLWFLSVVGVLWCVVECVFVLEVVIAVVFVGMMLLEWCMPVVGNWRGWLTSLTNVWLVQVCVCRYSNDSGVCIYGCRCCMCDRRCRRVVAGVAGWRGVARADGAHTASAVLRGCAGVCWVVCVLADHIAGPTHMPPRGPPHKLAPSMPHD